MTPLARARAAALVAFAAFTVGLQTPRGAQAQEAASATARLEPELIGVGQVVTLTLEALSSGLADLDLDPQFSLENLEIVSGPTQAQSWQFVNGRASRSESLIWRLRAKKVGGARVSQIVLKINDSVFELPDQTIQVQEEPIEIPDAFGRRRFADPFEDFPFPPRRRAPRREAEPKLFLRAEATPQEPFVGQQVLYTLYLFTQADVGAINPESVPDFAGFWVEDVPQPDKLQPEMVDIQGERYGRVVLLRKAVFPMHPGRVELEAVRARLVASMPKYSWLGSVIDRRREIYRTSNAVTLDVKALPEAPAGFRGAVGQLQLSTEVEPREVRVGEAATLTVKLEGRGNIQGVLEPELPVLEGMRVFPPEQSSRNRVAGTQVRGEKSWRYVLVPDRAGRWEIPPLSVDYFDPYDEAFRAAQAAPAVFTALAPLDAVPSVGHSEAPTLGPSTTTAGERDSESGGALHRWYRKPRFLLGSAALVTAMLLVPIARRLRNRGQSSKRLCGRLRDASTIQHGRRAADALENAWRDYLEERFDLPPGTAAMQWTQRLRDGGLKAAGLTELGRLVEDLEYLRYAPELSASESLIAELVARSLKLARGLR
ncbi:MAG: protein BatD [bacterium]|nr:protein BatD [bacterium]